MYFHLANTKNYENYDEIPEAYYERSGSVDSESNEVYNVSIKERPIRERNTELKSNFFNGIKTIDKSPSLYANSKQSSTSRLKDNRKCTQTHVSDYPYSVSILKKGAHYVSGALIHKEWIITVAEEFYNIRETIKLFRARLGSVNCKKGGALVPLKKIEIHPSYVYNQPGFDLAMLRIGQVLQCSNYIRPITLSIVKGPIANAKFLSTYWPRLMVNGKVLPQTAKERMKPHSMRVSTQKLIPWDKCYDIIQTYNLTLDSSSLCLEPIMSHHSPCMPDVGAPVIADDGLWGITSGWISDDCATYPSPTIFTRISLEPTTSWLDTLLDEDTK
ncbi:hypodermin-A-like [Pararge aegeria]|uniref:Jg13863 protein n=1 Tax=Pararge aegeria aegeria TaxID=348720 RepID=A0A8S4S563_9NEOP|nr:hypodermin-A-like [Pararge aegeria]CAH2252053.1 jg13863 [Pararge aegeria aegeria]